MKEENVTTVASNSKLLPLSKIVSARKFKKIEYLSDNFGALSLEDENIFVMTEYRAMHQDIRPLNVLILNLMQKNLLRKFVDILR